MVSWISGLHILQVIKTITTDLISPLQRFFHFCPPFPRFSSSPPPSHFHWCYPSLSSPHQQLTVTQAIRTKSLWTGFLDGTCLRNISEFRWASQLQMRVTQPVVLLGQMETAPSVSTFGNSTKFYRLDLCTICIPHLSFCYAPRAPKYFSSTAGHTKPKAWLCFCSPSHSFPFSFHPQSYSSLLHYSSASLSYSHFHIFLPFHFSL